jgi:hypothetical protein
VYWKKTNLETNSKLVFVFFFGVNRQGLTSAGHEILQAVTGVVTEPVAGAHKKGVRGAATGLASGLVNLVSLRNLTLKAIGAKVWNQANAPKGIVFIICLSSGVVTDPVAGAHKKGVRGAATGLASGLVNLVRPSQKFRK